MEFDVTYRQVVQPAGGPEGRKVQVTPIAGSSHWVGSPLGNARAVETPGVSLVFTGDGTLARIEGFGPANRGTGAGIIPVNFAPLYLLLPGTRPVRSEAKVWTYQDRIVLSDLGTFTVEVRGKAAGTEMAGGRKCRVVETTLTLPAGEIFAALVRTADPGIVGEGKEEIRARASYSMPKTGEQVTGAGTFTGEAVLHIPSLSIVQRLGAQGTFSMDLAGTR